MDQSSKGSARVSVPARAGEVFPPSRRLRKRREFQWVQARGERVRTPHCILLLRSPQQPSMTSRIGITVTRKVGCAVLRSRAKRIVREAFRSTRQALWQVPLDLVVIIRHMDPALKAQDIAREWLSVERRIQRAASACLQAPGLEAIR